MSVQLRGLKFAVPKAVVQDDLSAAVATAFSAALARLSAAGATIVEMPMAEFAQAGVVNPRGAISSVEAFARHRQWIKEAADKYDPRVVARIAQAKRSPQRTTSSCYSGASATSTRSAPPPAATTRC